MTLGEKLKKLRIERGYTQKFIADMLNVSFQTVSKWENDENEPDIGTLSKLARLFECTVDYLVNEEETDRNKSASIQQEQPQPQTIIIHQKEPHVCERCKKDINDEDLAVWEGSSSSMQGRHRVTKAYKGYYHKECLEQEKKERQEAAKKLRALNLSKAKKICFGWAIAGGIVALGISLAIFLVEEHCKAALHPVLAVFLAILAGYMIFATIYCILSGSYIGDVFLKVSRWSIKFPGLIFRFSLGGFIWLIAIKILFAIIAFFIGIFVFLLAVGLSGGLAMVSFPFILVHNINNDYEDAIVV